MTSSQGEEAGRRAMAAAAATAAATTSRAAPSADSYIGSLISLTSKSEIRYEGVLYNINTEESSIGLRNVRSFGTEGRKKDGQQIPPSDKIYEYILFRGSDIKDLQVKSSPPVQTAPSIHSDPAIIQSQYSRPPAPAFTSASLPSVGSGTIADLGSHTTQMMAPRSTFQSGLPLYQPGGSVGSWGPSPSPTPNGSGLAMPMYWQGYYAPSGGMPHLQPPPLLRPPGPPPGMSIPHAMQQPLQYPSISPSVQTGSQGLPGANVLLSPGLPNFVGTNASAQSATISLLGTTAPSGFSTASGVTASSNLPGISTSLSSGSPNVTGSNTLLSGFLNLPDFLPSLLPPVGGSLISTMMPSSIQTTSLSLDTPLIPLPNKPPVSSLPSGTTSDNLVPTVASASSKAKSALGTESIGQFTSSSIPSVTGSSSSILAEASGPSSSTNGQLQFGSSADSSSQPLEKSNKTTEVKPASSEQQKQFTVETKHAILPLPRPSEHKLNDAPPHTHHSNRGRGRGRGNTFSRRVTKFTEDFDFTAMNEKFNKDEVWGHLGKSRGHLRDKEGNEDENNYDDDEDIPDDYSEDQMKVEVKPVYVKDDFFDSLSCNSLDAGARNRRTKFSEQQKIDTETFGNFSRLRPGRGGGRGFRGGGRARGSFYGRGYGYSGRGRGYSY